MGSNLFRGEKLVLGCHCTDCNGIAITANAFERRNGMQIHQMFWCCHAQLHHWDQAVATGQRTGFFAQARQKLYRISHG